MGCGGSKEVPNLNNNNVTVEVKSTVDDQENSDKKDDDNRIEPNSIDSPSPIPLTPDFNVKDNAVNLPPYSSDKNIERVVNARESFTDSAFDGRHHNRPKLNETHIERVYRRKLIDVESDLDCEYGKDGIDLTSTSFALKSPKKSEVLDHGIQFEVTQRLTKVNKAIIST